MTLEDKISTFMGEILEEMRRVRELLENKNSSAVKAVLALPGATEFKEKLNEASSYNQKMKEYRVYYKSQTGKEVLCTDCGLEYPSLEDRMVKQPDDCHGCFMKAKWG